MTEEKTNEVSQEDSEKKDKKKIVKLKITEEALKELEDKAKLADEYLNHLKHLKADFENYKRRQEKEKDEFIKFANSGLLLELLPVLDSFDRAMNKVHSSHNLKIFEQGMELIYKQLFDVLTKMGLSKLEVIGEPFDPTKHEALMHIESEEYEEDIIAQELTKGYLLYGKILRPAQIAVSSGKKEKE